jgi:hypothetical protein
MRAAFFSSLAIVTLALPARAQETAQGQASFDTANMDTGDAAEDDPTIPGALVIGAEIGAIFPQPFTELGTHVAFGIELGYRLPFWDQRLEIMSALAFSPPNNDFTERRDDGDYSGEIDQQELTLSLGPRIHVMERSSPWNVTIAAGGRLFFLRTYSNGSRAGQEFAEFTEESTQMGFFFALGGEYVLGPGALFLDLDLGWSKLPHQITGDVNTGNIMATLGYRFFLL